MACFSNGDLYIGIFYSVIQMVIWIVDMIAGNLSGIQMTGNYLELYIGF